MHLNNELFKRSIKLLDDNKINYWICHGTLLGIIRDKQLLPWDQDIDFAIWDYEHSKEKILKIFSSEKGFTQEIVLEEINSLHFSTEGKRVDINFYSKDKDKAFIKWAVLPKSILKKILFFVSTFVAGDVSIEKALKSSGGKFIAGIKLMIILPLLILKKVLSNKYKRNLLKNAYKIFDTIGYSYPLNLMKFKKIKFLDIEITVPIMSEEVLKHTYGNDWKVPKKNYVWYKEANNLFQYK